MIPAIVLAGSRSDAVLCDCGEEVVRLYTYELYPGAIYYAIDGLLFEINHAYAENVPVTRAEPIEGGALGFSLSTTCQPLKGSFEFTAHAACDTCVAKRFHFRVVDGVLSAQD